MRDLGKPDFTFFNLMVSGHIQSGTINDHDGISCFFQFVHGVDWHNIEVSLPEVNSLLGQLPRRESACLQGPPNKQAGCLELPVRVGLQRCKCDRLAPTDFALHKP